LELTLYRDAEGFAGLCDEWNALLRRSPFDTIFLTWEWQSTWWQQLGTTRGPLYLLAARQGERLVGIIPLYLTGMPGNYTLQVVGCVEVSDYLDLLVESGQEEAVYAAFLDWLAGPDAPNWDCLELCNQPAPSQTYVRMPELAARYGWSVEVAHEDVCPVVDLPPTWDAYLETLDKKQRHEIRRKLRRVEREAPDARVRLVQGGDDLDEQIDLFIDLHRRSDWAKDQFMVPQMQAFFHAIARSVAEAGWLQLSFLEIAGQAVATYLCFDYRNQILVYNSGYDPALYPQLSSGWVLLSHVIRNAIAQGRSRLDFLQGNEDYKYRFGGKDTLVYRTLIRR
jgi:CelD/BcsL family acetyltransferase involved in cellulose biosynthesis